jgi:hypothetical protein
MNKDKIFTEQQIEVIKEIVRDEIKKADATKASAKKVAEIVNKEMSKYFKQIDQETDPDIF